MTTARYKLLDAAAESASMGEEDYKAQADAILDIDHWIEDALDSLDWSQGNARLLRDRARSLGYGGEK